MVRPGIETVAIGQSTTFTHTITDHDIHTFATLSGDHHPQHTDDAYAQNTRFGQRIAHGALVVAYISAAFTEHWRRFIQDHTDQPAISYGYDRIRFIKPVLIGDTLTVEHRIAELAPADDKAFAQLTVTNHHGETVAAATHIIKFV
jgi:3-hydroxybutyryl-CoA dehydratase